MDTTKSVITTEDEDGEFVPFEDGDSEDILNDLTEVISFE
jgi:hypothetical protein